MVSSECANDFSCRGTGGGKLPGLRGRILSLVGVASAIGVCPNFFEDAEEGGNVLHLFRTFYRVNSVQFARCRIELHRRRCNHLIQGCNARFRHQAVCSLRVIFVLVMIFKDFDIVV